MSHPSLDVTTTEGPHIWTYVSVQDYNKTAENAIVIGHANYSQPLCEKGLVYEQQESMLHDFARSYAQYHGYVSAVVCTFGIIANIANIITLKHKNMRSSINFILTWLAVADLGTMLSYLPVSVHFYILKDPILDVLKTRNMHWIRFLQFHSSFTIVCHTVAIWLTIVLAIFRFLYMHYPSDGPRLCSMKRAQATVALVYILPAIVCLPNYLVNGVKRFCDTRDLLVTSGNKTHPHASMLNVTSFIYGVDNSELAERYHVIAEINYWLQAVLVKLIPCLVLTILTVLLILIIHKANQRRARLMSEGRRDESERHRETNRTTTMLLLVVMLFLITELPQGIMTILNSIIPNFFQSVYNPLGDIMDTVALLNNSINFVLYCTMSKQFRDTFISIFFTWCPERRKPGWLKLKVVRATLNGHSTTDNTGMSYV